MTPLAKATPFQRQMLEAYIERGTIKDAAAHIGIKEQAGRHRLMAMYKRTGVKNAAEAAYWLGWERARAA